MGSETVLVTGGAGFIGSAIAKQLVDIGDDVIIVDNLTTGQRDNVPDGTTFIEGDISNKNITNKLHEYEIETVFHLAAQSSGEKSFDDPRYDFRSHVVGTFNLLRWCQSSTVERFVYASSMSVYGDPTYLPVDEQHPVDHKTFYAAGKLAAEAYVQLFDNMGLNTTIFRLFSVYGPNQNMNNMKQGMVSIYISFLLRDEVLLIKGSTDRFRDFVYIDDVVDAWIEAKDAPTTHGEIYNISREKKITVEHLVECMLKYFGEPNYPVEVADGTPGDQFGIYGDSSKLRQDINWTPNISIEQGLTEMIESETDC